MASGTGYWAKFPSPGTQNFTGLPLPSTSISVNAGWNLIGSVDHSVAVPSGVLIAANIFTYSNGYDVASTIEPGKAYWVRQAPAVSSRSDHKRLQNLLPILSPSLPASRSPTTSDDHKHCISLITVMAISPLIITCCLRFLQKESSMPASQQVECWKLPATKPKRFRF